MIATRNFRPVRGQTPSQKFWLQAAAPKRIPDTREIQAAAYRLRVRPAALKRAIEMGVLDG